MKTKQEIFDGTLTHLRKQKVASTLERRTMFGESPRICAYRGENGTMCAIGCHIPDSKYTPDLEELSGASAMVMEATGFSGQGYAELLQALQKLHDSVLAHYGLAVWEYDMQSLAAQQNLLYTPKAAS